MTSLEEEAEWQDRALTRANESVERRAAEALAKKLAWTLDVDSEDAETVFKILKTLKCQRMPKKGGYASQYPAVKTTELLELVFHPRVFDSGQLRVMVRVGSTIRRIKANEFELVLTNGSRCTFRFTGGVMTLLQRPSSSGVDRVHRHAGRAVASLRAVRSTR